MRLSSVLGRVSVWAVQPRAPQSSPRGGGGVSASPPAKPALLYPVRGDPRASPGSGAAEHH